MREITFNTPVIKVESLETKFDLSVVSNSLVALLEDYLEARIVQQLHYWLQQGYGVVIDGIRWIYKPLHEWLSEAILGFSTWQLRKAIASLLEKELIRQEKKFTQHQMQQGDRFWWQPKNQTYYYSLNYDRLQRLMEETEKASNDEDNRVVSDTKLSNEDFTDTKCCENYSFYTKNTSIKNNSKDQSHPTLPNECDKSKPTNQNKDSIDTSELSSSFRETKDIGNQQKVIEKEISHAFVDDKINQNISIKKEIDKPKPKKIAVEQRRKKQAPWKNEGQFKRFYRALIQALPIVANSHSPQGLAQTIIRQLRCGIPHSYWDDFVAGLPIGSSTKPEWEIEPGEPYPMFVEYLTEKLKAGNNTTSDEQTRNEVFRILNQPKIAKAFWGQFKRSVVNVSQQVERARALGVTNPHTPVWTRERVEPSLEEAAVAGEKIMAANSNASTAPLAAIAPQLSSKKPSSQLSSSDNSSIDRQSGGTSEEVSDPWNEGEVTEPTEPVKPSLRELLTKRLGSRNLKGFVKTMPKVSQDEAEAEAKAEKEALSRQRMNRKTHLNSLSIDEINRLLADPIMRKELTPQIIVNDKFEVVTDNLGEVLAVKINWEYLKNGGT